MIHPSKQALRELTLRDLRVGDFVRTIVGCKLRVVRIFCLRLDGAIIVEDPKNEGLITTDSYHIKPVPPTAANIKRYIFGGEDNPALAGLLLYAKPCAYGYHYDTQGGMHRFFSLHELQQLMHDYPNDYVADRK